MLAIVAVYEVVLALGWPSIGDAPGAGAPGATGIFLAGAAAVLAGVVLGSPLLAPLAGLHLVAFHYTYDPYFAPSLRRYADGNVRPAWTLGLLAVGIALAVLRARRPFVSAYLLVVLVTLFLASDGH